jgi:hypothetical protein
MKVAATVVTPGVSRRPESTGNDYRRRHGDSQIAE